MMSFGVLKYCESVIKKLKKSLYSINHVIYICTLLITQVLLKDYIHWKTVECHMFTLINLAINPVRPHNHCHQFLTIVA